jgi:hypothetical protein
MRICCRSVLPVMMLFLPVVASGGTLDVTVTWTVPLQNVYPVFILCDGVQAASCNQNAVLPLILTENEGSGPGLPPGNGQDLFQPINFTPLWSGFITYIALPQGSTSNVVIGLANGVVTAGSPWPFVTPESQIAADVLGGSQAQQQDLINFFLANLSDFPQMGSAGAQVGNIWEFSNAVSIGSYSAAQLTPEPSTMELAGAAFVCLLLAGRRLRLVR